MFLFLCYEFVQKGIYEAYKINKFVFKPLKHNA